MPSAMSGKTWVEGRCLTTCRRRGADGRHHLSALTFGFGLGGGGAGGGAAAVGGALGGGAAGATWLVSTVRLLERAERGELARRMRERAQRPRGIDGTQLGRRRSPPVRRQARIRCARGASSRRVRRRAEERALELGHAREALLARLREGAQHDRFDLL